MAVVFAERPLSLLPRVMAACVGMQLAVFGIPTGRINREVAALRTPQYGKNRSRSLLGILNEVAFQFEAEADATTIATADELLRVQTGLNEIPHRASTSSCIFARHAIVDLLGDLPVN